MKLWEKWVRMSEFIPCLACVTTKPKNKKKKMATPVIYTRG